MAYYGSRLAAQGTGAKPATGSTGAAAPAPQPQTKVAILNLSVVIKKYKKFENYQASYKAKVDDMDKVLKPLKTELDKLQAEAAKPTVDPATKTQMEKQFKELNFTMTNKVDEYKKTLADFDAAQFTTIYNDIKNMTARYAKSRGIELVMHYNDVTTEAEMNTANNIGRRMNQGACFPLYVTPGMDISEEVLAYLNQSVASAPTTYTPPAGH
jgi:Skp family chaperone for outer membrane proteins